MMEDDLWQLCLQATIAHKKGKFISLFQKAVGLVSPRLGRLLSLCQSWHWPQRRFYPQWEARRHRE